MDKKGQMAMGRQIPLNEVGKDVIIFWQQQNASVRFAEAERLMRVYHIWKDGIYPEHIIKVVKRVRRDEH